MSNKTRKRLWPVALVMAVAAIGVMALAIALAGSSGSVQAHGAADGHDADDCVGVIKPNVHNTLHDPDCLAAPMNLAAMANSSSQITVSWDAVTGAESYVVERKTGPGSYGNAVTATSTSQAITGLTAGTTYMFQVRADSAAAGLGIPAEVSGTTDEEGGGGTQPMAGPCDETDADGNVTLDRDACVFSSTTSASASPELRLLIESLDDGMSVGSSIVLYLEDDYQEPDSISASSVYIVATNAADLVARRQTGNESRVYLTVAPRIKTGAYFDPDKKDISIQVLVPDMCTNATDECEGPNGLNMGQQIEVVFESSAGIKNPSEEKAGGYHTGYTLLGPTGRVTESLPFTQLNNRFVLAKITPSDVDNSRGYEMTITGSGFNNGTSAAVHVLGDATPYPEWWNSTSCEEMQAISGTMDNSYCMMWDQLSQAQMDALYAINLLGGGPAEATFCRHIIRTGQRAGIATVGSDDKVAVTFEVTVPTFVPGNNNYICMVDGEGRTSSTDVEDFKLEPSIRVVPSSASTGDTVNVFAQDYPNARAGFTQLKIAGQDVTSLLSGSITSTSINEDGSGTATFELPGSIEGSSLEGTLRIDARWGGVAPFDVDKGVNEDGKVTVLASALRLSQAEVRANDSITIQGEGFGDQTTINPADITMDGVPLHVDNDSLDGGVVKVSNAGQFVATVAIWKAQRAADNPALIAGTHTIKVRDSGGFLGTATIVVKEPSINTLPLVAGPRDVITVTGENWPVDNPEGGSVDSVEIEIDDDPNRQPRKYTAIPDLTGRFTLEHRVSRDVGIPSDNQIKVTYGDSGEVVKISSFAVPESIIEVSPAEAQPGETISLSVSGMPVYTNVFSIEVGGRNVLGGQNFSTDRTGAVTSDVIVPGLDPGTYSVIMEVGEEEQRVIAIGEVEILSEGAIGTEVTAADGLANLGDNLVAVFHFNNAAKEWSFYDPRPEFADLNTLDNMVQGEAYWILIAEDVEEVVLNNKVRSLTCRGDDCWNLEVW